MTQALRAQRVSRNTRETSGRLSSTTLDALKVRRLVTDSRAVRAGDTFVALPGETRDGREYIAQALTKGAASVLWEKRNYVWDPSWRVPNLGVADLRRRAGEIASRVYGWPSANLWMVGVTGTNGKTSCSHWIAQSLKRGGRKCAVIGTLGSGFPGRLEAAQNTTPDAVRVHGLLRDFVRRGAQACAMEVSSIGLVQHRVAGVEFDVAVLTNVSRDHLDYHGTMRKYRAAKSGLFEWPALKWAVLNLDDPFGASLSERLRRQKRNVVGYGFAPVERTRLESSRLLRVQGRNLRVSGDGLSFDVSTPWGSATLASQLIGRFNAANLLATLAALLASDTRLEDAVNAVQRVKALPGRTERHGGGRLPLVIIDYAHTPDALEQVLRALREAFPGHIDRKRHRAGRVICVFGCGGGRDRGKRALMGEVARRLADLVIVTSDNPRSEDPLAIIRDIVQGARGRDTTVEPDRVRAIRGAISAARAGDVVLIAGKGHEQYQDIGGVKYPFSDAAEVTAALRAFRGRA
ncbi:MAG: UDP-N-acetylmuramoyl-L-alanyl-D-glutamate--2,6-diaminopimelate ligase [Burkholderiales bacterium]|nr:UDP-N-acetylmuramoyl-L-alanyl-D-glutamate--2,6-diaminopimelate ligase [Burkholderiales bacterium]